MGDLCSFATVPYMNVQNTNPPTSAEYGKWRASGHVDYKEMCQASDILAPLSRSGQWGTLYRIRTSEYGAGLLDVSYLGSSRESFPRIIFLHPQCTQVVLVKTVYKVDTLATRRGSSRIRIRWYMAAPLMKLYSHLHSRAESSEAGRFQGKDF